jgi:hypothetical protein
VLRLAAEHYSAQLAGRIDAEAELCIDYEQLRQQCEAAAAADTAGKPAGAGSCVWLDCWRVVRLVRALTV